MRSFEHEVLSAKNISTPEKQLRYVSEAFAFDESKKKEEDGVLIEKRNSNIQQNTTLPVTAHRFLDLWTMQNRKYSTQDQVSFPYVSQMLQVHPLSLPYKEIYGTYDFNNLFLKLVHGK